MGEHETKTVEVTVSDGTKMTIHWAAPPQPAKAGILVLQEAFGVNAHIRDVVQRFAREGYLAAAPELFHRTAQRFETGYNDFSAVAPHFQAMTLPGIEADLKATHGWLLSQSKQEARKIAAIGFCLGGRAAFIANATLPLGAAISFYGGRIAPDLLPMAGKQYGPIMLIWGGLDQHNPMEKNRSVADALTTAGKDFVHVEFSKADHGFFCDQRKQFNPQAASEAWALSLAFLQNRLGQN